MVFCDITKALKLPTEDPEKWAEKYDIEPLSTDCDECGREKRTNIPFAHGRYRGLMAAPCPCGSKSRTYCMVVAPGMGNVLDGKKEEW